MSMNCEDKMNRRTVLIAGVGVAPLLAFSPARAASLPPTAVSYQTTSKDGKKCSDCNLFVAPNACKSVSGVIAPTGWCKLFVKKA